ncbi:MAG: CooT family nickel-binding protein [Actinobacteria bacterium]|nr:CooT family nickel-binding protein [Actinomycetota bacterium]
MCETKVFIEKNGKKEEIFENVINIQSEEDGLLIKDLFGEQKLVKANIKYIDFMKHEMVLTETENDE